MSMIDALADSVSRNIELAKMTVEDFSAADMMVHPAPGANNAMWQLGHLVGSEAHMINAYAPGTVPAPAGDFSACFTRETNTCDDPAKFPSKEQVLAELEKARAATVKWIRSLKPEDFGRATPESMRAYAPTVMDLVLLLCAHVAMHVGQMQVTRRKLGKPVLY